MKKRQNNCTAAIELLNKANIITTECIKICEIDYPYPELRGFQGGCSDGEKYYYTALMHYDFDSNQEDNYTCIVKTDLTSGKEVQRSERLKLNHANDITYNRKKNLLVVCNNKPNYKRLTLIDASTLEFIKYVELPFGVYSIDYNEERDVYAVGISGTWDFRLLDSELSVLDDKIFKGSTSTSRYTKQGMCVDDELIYFILWDGKYKDLPGFQNVISVYDWEGRFKGLIEFDVGVKEPESLSIVNQEIFTLCGTKKPIIYKFIPKLK